MAMHELGGSAEEVALADGPAMPGQQATHSFRMTPRQLAQHTAYQQGQLGRIRSELNIAPPSGQPTTQRDSGYAPAVVVLQQQQQPPAQLPVVATPATGLGTGTGAPAQRPRRVRRQHMRGPCTKLMYRSVVALFVVGIVVLVPAMFLLRLGYNVKQPEPQGFRAIVAGVMAMCLTRLVGLVWRRAFKHRYATERTKLMGGEKTQNLFL